MTIARGIQTRAHYIAANTRAVAEQAPDFTMQRTVALKRVQEFMHGLLDTLDRTVPSSNGRPRNVLEAYRPTDEMVSLQLPRKPVQNSDCLFEIYRRSAAAHEPLGEHLRCVATEMGAVAVVPPLKNESRAAQKAAVDTGKARGVRDWARATIVVDSVADINEAVTRLINARKTFQARYCSDHVTEPRKSGLRQIQLFLEYAPEQILVEVQVTPQPMFEMYRVEHSVYEMIRAVDAALSTRKQAGSAGDSGLLLSVDEADLLISCGAFSRDCYRLATDFLSAGKPMPDECCSEFLHRANSLVMRHESTLSRLYLEGLNGPPPGTQA